MKLSEINYPVYRLRNDPPIQSDGFVFYASEKHTEDESGGIVTDTKLLMVDDRQIEGDSLAARRLRIPAKLFPLRQAIFFLGDLIKLATPNTWFIDSLGKVFVYEKNTRAQLKCHKISMIATIPSGGAIIGVEGIDSRFKTLHTPENVYYAGILHMGKSLVLYGLYSEPFKQTWRMV